MGKQALSFVEQYGSMVIMAVFLILMLVLMVVLFVLLIYKPIWQKRKTKGQPVITCAGTVIEKYMTVVPAYYASRSVPHIAFETTDGQRFVLEVENEQYGLIFQGDKGILSFRQYKYKRMYYLESFKRNI